MADRIFYLGVGIQILHWLLSSFIGSEIWVLQAIFWLWLALVPIIGFLAGRGGSGLGKSGGLAALLCVTWFFIGALDGVFSSSAVSADHWLKGMGSLALSSLLFGVAAFLVAVLAAQVGRRFRVPSA